MHDSASSRSAIFISPVFSISVNFHTCVPEPMSSPRNLPLSIGPPEMPIVGRSHDAAPISSAGVVLSQPIISTTPSNGLARIDSSTSIAVWLRNSIVVGPHQRFAQAHHRELDRKAAGVEDAVAHVLRQFAEVRVARRGLRPRVADADDRPAVELVVRNALVLHPRPVDERVAIVAGEPGLGAQGALGFVCAFLVIADVLSFTRRVGRRFLGRTHGLWRDRWRGRSGRRDSRSAGRA